MRPLTALTIALFAPVAAPIAATACPPPPEGYVPPSREEQLRARVQAADAIVDARVERSIGHGQLNAAEDTVSGDPGTIRIRHVYKGDLRPGQRLRMYGVTDEGTSCGGAFRYETRFGRTGTTGLLFLYRRDLDRPTPLPFYEFVPQAEVEEMVRLGLIRSAERR